MLTRLSYTGILLSRGTVPEGSCSSARRLPMSALGMGVMPKCNLCSNWLQNHGNAFLLNSPQVPALILLHKWWCRCQNEVTGLGEIATAVTSASKKLLLTSHEKLDTEYFKKQTLCQDKQEAELLLPLENCSPFWFFDCRFSKNQWLIRAVSQREKWAWSLSTGRNSSCQIQSYSSEYLARFCVFLLVLILLFLSPGSCLVLQ